MHSARWGSAVSEAVADEPVQTDPLLGGSESEFTVEGLGNPDVELSGESTLADRLRDRLTGGLQVTDHVGDEINQAPESLGLVRVKP